MSCDNSTISWMEQWCERLMKLPSKWRPARCKPANLPASRWFPMSRCLVLNLLLSLWLLIVFAPQGRADDQALDQFLARLGLVDLRLANMERMLARETVLEKRQTLARTLADTYAEELLSAADEPQRFESLKLRLEKLLANSSAARSASVEVALLQADYQ